MEISLIALTIWLKDYVIDKWDEVSVSEEFERCCAEVAAGEYVFFNTASSICILNWILDGAPMVEPRSCPCSGDCVHRLLRQHKSNNKQYVGTVNSVNKYGSFNVEDGLYVRVSN